jgi:predicted secreted protein
MQTNYQIGIGESFQVELTANPSTGYAWKWTNKPGDSLIVVTDTSYSAGQSATMGGGGKEVWKFKGVKIGDEVIKLEYNQSWGSDPSSETIELTVTVK